MPQLGDSRRRLLPRMTLRVWGRDARRRAAPRLDWPARGTSGTMKTMACDSSNDPATEPHRGLELALDAARANWDAAHGARHLAT
jgi:hypothetical protein